MHDRRGSNSRERDDRGRFVPDDDYRGSRSGSRRSQSTPYR